MMPFNDFFNPYDHFSNFPETEVETLPENDNGMLTRIVHEEFLKIWTACREDNFVTFDTLAGLIYEKKKTDLVNIKEFCNRGRGLKEVCSGGVAVWRKPASLFHSGLHSGTIFL